MDSRHDIVTGQIKPVCVAPVGCDSMLFRSFNTPQLTLAWPHVNGDLGW